MKLRKLGVTLVLLFVASIIKAAPTEKDLVETWEQLQKSDPKVLLLEKIDDKQYKFKTDYFPFEGKLIILNVFIDDKSDIGDTGFITGSIDTDLVDFSQEAKQKYFRGYGKWIESNTLFYDKAENKWVSNQVFINHQKRKASKFIGWSYLISFGLPALLLLFIFSLARRSKKAMSAVAKSQQMMEKSISLQEDSNRVLTEILETLKRKQT